MQSILSIHSSFGLPLCVSGITHRLDLSIQILDHDLRREALKKQRSLNRERLLANPNMGSDEISIGGIDGRVIEEGDLVFGDLNDLLLLSTHNYMCCNSYTAKAA